MGVKPFKRYRGKGARWYFKYRNESGQWVRRVGTTSYRDTDALRAHLENQAKLIRQGVLDPRHATAQSNAVRPIDSIIDEFESWLSARSSQAHTRWTIRYVKRCIEATGAACLRDIEAKAVFQWLADTFTGARSHNAALKAVRHLIRWSANRHYMLFDPLAGVSCLDEAPQRRVRVIERDEFERLVSSVKPYRAVFYQLAAYAMIRWREVARLSWGDIDFKGMAIVIRKGADKAKRGDVVPMYSRLAELLADWKSPKCSANDPVVPKEPRIKTWKEDLNRAGIPFKTDDGTLPRKTLRSSAITWLLEAGQPLPHVAKIARHQDAKITMKHYAKLRLLDLNDVIEKFSKDQIRTKARAQDVEGGLELSHVQSNAG